ncbi:MAG: sodium:solute symporter [Candidatus Solibacter usitatus]|nr:sodium:solute symporter [Candidatus Solibacter usitatus]
MNSTRWLDLIIVVLYLLAMALVGLRFSRRQTSTESFFMGKRSVPSWAMGLSMLATLISSVTFVAYPGSSYAKDWSLLVPGFLVVGVLIAAGSVIIPFYRQAVGMSAYEYFEKRFGRPARVYASAAFTLAHFSKMAFVFYLMALTINSITGWNIEAIIAVVCGVMIFYTMVGGIEAVIWTDVIQAFITWAGVFVCLGYLLFLPPGGPSAVFQLAAQHGKFSLGSLDMNFAKPTIPVLILYGFFWYLQRYGADQTIVQRYLVAKSDRGALRGVALGALLCVPVWALFMLVGTCTWAFFQLTGNTLPAHVVKADQVFPYFVGAYLPVGVAGLFMASLIGAAMTMLASDLNCLAAVGVEDFYRARKPDSTDAQRLRAGRIMVAIVGVLAALIAVALAHTKGNALSMWFAVSAIVSGGLAGLFLLAFLSDRAHARGAYLGIGVSALFTIWAVLTKGDKKLVDLGTLNFGWDELMIGAVGHVLLFTVGYVGSLVLPRNDSAVPPRPMTLWGWLERRR